MSMANRGFLTAALVIAAAALVEHPLAFGSTRSLAYTVSVDSELVHMTTTLCIEGLKAVRLEAGADEMRQFLKRAVRLDGQQEIPLARDRDAIVLDRPTGCVRLEIDLGKAKEEGDRDVAMIVGRDLILSPDLF